MESVFIMELFSKNESILKSKIRAVIFDFDGTTANTMPFLTGLAVKLITEKYNISKYEAKKRYLETTGIDFECQLELIFPNHPINHEVATTFESKKMEGIFAYPIFSDVIPILKYFRNKKIKTFICSGTNQEIIKKYFRLKKIYDLVDCLLGYNPDFAKSEQIDFVLHYYKMQPNEVLFVGDSLFDNDFAKEKRIKFIGISRIFKKNPFKKIGALSVSLLTDLEKFFDKF